MHSPNDSPVYVALSGGVDSSVAAALLVEAGHRVVGVTLQLVDCKDATGVKVCCGAEAFAAARKVCRHLGIEHRIIDCREQFRSLVLEPAWQTYACGRTPSPCIICNSTIKFGFLLDESLRAGARYVASGHHARIEARPGNGRRLRRGVDPIKDQSYFLFMLDQNQLEHLLFPIGGMIKSDVRERARQMNIPTAERVESTVACFQHEGERFAETLMAQFGGAPRKGNFVDRQGNVLGRHRGIHLFTIGQRRGLGIALGRRMWVEAIDGETGQVTLTDDEDSLLQDTTRVGRLRWTGRARDWQPKDSFRCQAQIRYQHRAAACQVELRDTDVALVHFDEPQRAMTPGQAVVFYDDEWVIGGGWIEGATQG